MRTVTSVAMAVLGLVLSAGIGAHAYERELNSRQLREAYFLGRDTTFRLERFLKDYERLLPVPEGGVHVERIALATPFKEMVDRARRAPDSYNPLKAEEGYKQTPPVLTVEVTLKLTPSYPAHSPYRIPNFRRVLFRDPDFWQDFSFRLVQAEEEILPLVLRGHPLFLCSADGGCWLTGAVISAVFDPEKVASAPTRAIVLTPDGQQVEAQFDLARLR
jgi:hypothetical protein